MDDIQERIRQSVLRSERLGIVELSQEEYDDLCSWCVDTECAKALDMGREADDSRKIDQMLGLFPYGPTGQQVRADSERLLRSGPIRFVETPRGRARVHAPNMHPPLGETSGGAA